MGQAALKTKTVEVVNECLRGLRRRRLELLADPAHLDGVVLDGVARATAVASRTLDEVRTVMAMDYFGAGQARRY